MPLTSNPPAEHFKGTIFADLPVQILTEPGGQSSGPLSYRRRDFEDLQWRSERSASRQLQQQAQPLMDPFVDLDPLSTRAF
ncbi:unnamed protein product [Protopolystoma xenopodis]|uniref:Uncharacterized protein n=1 Tax=Protopolystoma xenopodis TaxID=117903 RepID=A0A448XDT6_9PLAT|nr:unnamed protein product [Protopolystoma xenopodis]